MRCRHNQVAAQNFGALEDFSAVAHSVALAGMRQGHVTVHMQSLQIGQHIA